MHHTICSKFCRSFGIELGKHEDVDSHLYKPSKGLATYLNWTFYASFSAVFFSFLVIFIVLCLIFAGLHETPRRAIRQAAAVRLAPEGWRWLNQRFENALHSAGKVPAAELAGLDWPAASVARSQS